MKTGCWLWLLLIISGASAKAPEVYQCQQTDGSVVIQDRKCLVTHSRPAPEQAPKPNTRHTPQARRATPGNSRTVIDPQARVTRPQTAAQSRSAYFQLGWERFLPANWLLVKDETPFVHHLWLSLQRFTGGRDFLQGVKLSVYPSTHRSYRQGAFSHALNLYHAIREQHQQRLLDSQFKSHERYKVFTLKYQMTGQQIALTEFYIDEANNDLFVLTIQSEHAAWRQHEQLAMQIISQL